MLRFECLVNNLNFLMPEKFIEPFYLAFKVRKEHADLKDVPQPHMKRMKTHEVAEEADEGVVILVEDEGGVALDMDDDTDESDSLSGGDGSDEDGSGLTIEVVVLDRVRVSVKRELVRQLMEIYNLASMQPANQMSTSAPSLVPSTSSPSLLASSSSSAPSLSPVSTSLPVIPQSHFQYILENSTEANIYYSQAGTLDMKVLAPAQRAPFSFSNPFLPKLLDFALEVWPLYRVINILILILRDGAKQWASSSSITRAKCT